MWMLGPIGFTAPLILLALVALPILWIVLRAVPPAPIRRRFPGVALLLGLTDDETQTDRTPWWLLLLRTLAAAAVIIGFAGPVLNPQVEETGSGPLLIVIDGSWAEAPDWGRRLDRIAAVVEDASRAGRPVALVQRTDFPAGAPEFLSADRWANRISGLEPKPWAPAKEAQDLWIAALGNARFDSVWFSDGLDRPIREQMLEALEARGTVRVLEGGRAALGLLPAGYADGIVQVGAVRSASSVESEIEIAAIGLDPAGVERSLASVPLRFDAGEAQAQAELSLPPELRNRITRFEIVGNRSAGAVTLTDDSLKRREVALIASRDDREGLELLSPLHFLRQALEPTADLLDGALVDLLVANPDAVVLADVARLAPAEQDGLIEWVEKGGLLVRFAGPQVAASDLSRAEEDSLMPVRLRVGGRSVGGAMSWGEPKTIRTFSENSPFFGLDVPEEVVVRSQVMAQPDPDLSERVIAALTDGTPLVTRKRLGEGQVVLFHVTANAEWSNLPLSGLFVQMLERLALYSRPTVPSAEDLAGTTWTAARVLDGFGAVSDAGTLPGVPGERLAARKMDADMPPGLYTGSDERSIALNVLSSADRLQRAAWPARIAVEGMGLLRETPLKGHVLAAALLMLALDIFASLWLSGRLRGAGGGVAAAIALAVLLPATPVEAQEDVAEELAILATSEVVLAHVLTGDDSLDRVAAAGLAGVGDALYRRTSVEPAAPMGVNLETDELAFYPLLYWPVSETQPIPSAEAYARLNQYLRNGGMILFDTRDADIGGFGSGTPTGRKLQQLAQPLDIPPLEPLPQDHVLTRTFYLLQDFPGRFASRDVWVEAAPADAEQVEGMPFRNLNDGVTPIVIGGNDWAAAWAIDELGNTMFPVGRGYAGERQRELALRFGVNLVMHVLTGNYKSDQVHVPALLDRLGQ
ncbi:putative membrane protein (TIGR02226 family) [Aliiruegeria haliotis]|uniref:Putative membrane protein (TIGR02226 family) n=1 Tax=Aliiruegeria haliotis TaxID=1280846 RepID=A0A2T0RRD3_9RHOB|nr:DUF4159 domain-containing protein [Aliiruegeria haliotis]PRY23765.1 putative membrane protein (TIGR02226 family) [Aliiruegeria haliotis]